MDQVTLPFEATNSRSQVIDEVIDIAVSILCLGLATWLWPYALYDCLCRCMHVDEAANAEAAASDGCRFEIRSEIRHAER